MQSMRHKSFLPRRRPCKFKVYRVSLETRYWQSLCRNRAYLIWFSSLCPETELPERSSDCSSSLSRFTRSSFTICSSCYARKWQPESSSKVKFVFSLRKSQRWPTTSASLIFIYWNYSLVSCHPSVDIASVRILKSLNYLTVTFDKHSSLRHLTVDSLPNSRKEFIDLMLSMPISLFEYVMFCRLTPYWELRTPWRILLNSWSFMEQSSRWIFKMCVSALVLFSMNFPSAIE